MDLFQELQAKFPDLIGAVEAASAEQVSIGLAGPDVRPIAECLRAEYACRLVTVFAEDRTLTDGFFYNHYVFERPGAPSYLILEAPIPADKPRFPSLAAELPSVNWQEREIQDWFGLEAVGHPNPRPVALHDNWPEVFPLRKGFPLRHVLPPFEGERHVYRPTLGEGVFQIPVGPVHAGIIEPGHFNFAVAGEPILYLQLRMFYTHKGTEKLFEDIPIRRAVFLAESISGDSSFSHGTAFCQAIERAAGMEIPVRALVMRTILLELERVYNHIADIGAISTDVGFVVANAHAGRLREMVVRLNEALTGSRLLRGMVCVGGVRRNWSIEQSDLLRDTIKGVEREFDNLVALVQSSDSTRDRLERTGILRPETAQALGIVGVGGRASGVDLAYPQGTANQVFGNQPYASALRAGVRIGPKGRLTQGRGTMGGGIFTGAPQYLGPWADSGKAVNHRYVGLKFVIHGKVHFGWARLNVRVYRNPEATVSAVLTGYAYETVPNKPIVAGKTKSPDRVNADQNVSLSAPPTQTATLGLLALGSPALSIWRREESVGAKQ